MKNIIIISSLIIFNTSFAQQAPKGKIVLQALFDGIGIKEEVTPVTPPQPNIIPSPTPEIIPTEKPLSKGELAIKEQLEKNKKILAQKKEEEAKNPIPADPNSMQELRKKNQAWMRDMKKQNQETLASWKKEIDATYAEWREKRKVFLKNLKSYKQNLYPLQAEKPLTKNELKLSGLTMKLAAEHYVIPGALDLPIKDQGKRPTCAAFAGARSIETLLKAQGQDLRASEQYIYWASKPTCQSTPCNQKGSWTSIAFEKSKASSKFDIPLEEDCPYNYNPLDGNETQIPLANQCTLGKIKVIDFDYLKNFDETIEALKKNYPIIAGFELTPNFYETNGLVKEAEAYTQGNLDNHAKGHALLLVGYIKLPPELQAKEGKACFIAANSWGEGYGRGGFTCLSEKWMMAHRVPNAFIALKDVKFSR